MNLLQETKYLMKKYNIIANKNYGQNFLIDEETLQKIIDTADISKEDLIIEIVPGESTFSEYLFIFISSSFLIPN